MAIRYQTFFFRRKVDIGHLSISGGLIFLFLLFFLLRFLLHFSEDLCLVLYEQVITRYLRTYIEIETTKKKRGVSIWLLREGFWENFTRT